eukprot:TRINITY_DN312_c0_g1_i2.p1 TRINITY_DN312_c0_g1~~TRINITY_DN312_c0_g1_i2.p1  ORF type:complete len:502 (-),score=142.02 TRINITY_DN312_c0_g1_i2:27-1454(-)
MADELDHDKMIEIEEEVKEAINDEDTMISIKHKWRTVDDIEYEQYHQQDTLSDGSGNVRNSKSFLGLKLRSKDAKIPVSPKKESLVLNQLPRGSTQIMAETWLEIRIMSYHDKTIVTDVLETIDRLGLHIMKGHTEEHHNHEEEVYFAKCQAEGSVTRKKARQALSAVFKKHGLHSQILIKRVQASDVYSVSKHIPRTATTIQAMGTGQLLDDVEEGYEIELEIDHAERDPHLLAQLARELTTNGLDVTSVDLDEQDDADHHLTMSLFVRGDGSPTKEKQQNIRDAIRRYCEKHGLPVISLTVAVADKFAAIEALNYIEPRSKTPDLNMKSPELRKCATSILSTHSTADISRVVSNLQTKDNGDIDLEDGDRDEEDRTPYATKNSGNAAHPAGMNHLGVPSQSATPMTGGESPGGKRGHERSETMEILAGSTLKEMKRLSHIAVGGGANDGDEVEMGQPTRDHKKEKVPTAWPLV